MAPGPLIRRKVSENPHFIHGCPFQFSVPRYADRISESPLSKIIRDRLPTMADRQFSRAGGIVFQPATGCVVGVRNAVLERACIENRQN